jgi:uncharacterized glyoxalase superfamily protein PhnB
MATKKKRPAPKKKAAPKSQKAPKKRMPARSQPETLRLRSVSLSLTSTDLQRSIAFYRDVLGFMMGDEWRTKGALMGVELHAGAVTFMLSQDDFAKGRDRLKGIGTRFYCGTAQDIDRLASQIKERGGVLDQEPKMMEWGSRVFMISDPDGFKLTFVQES